MDISELKDRILEDFSHIKSEERLEKIYISVRELAIEEAEEEAETLPYCLTPEQEAELDLAIAEAEDEANLLDWDAAKKLYNL